MRVAALYDIHGNLPALEAVLAELDADPVDELVVGGDVLLGPLPVECVALLAARGARFLAGNCERLVLDGDDETARWCRDRLDAELRTAAASWPATIGLDLPALGRVLFCHATPRSDVENLTRLTPDAAVAEALAGAGADVVVGGHTHVQLDRAVPGAPKLVNAGSVGMSYQGLPGAFWALLGDEVELRWTAYPVEPAIERLRAAGYPDFEQEFPAQMRGEVAAESATEHFESLRRGA